MKGHLPDRPVGVRRSWRKVAPNLAALGERLRLASWLVRGDWGDPIEAAEYRERKGTLRRVEALYANGLHLSMSLRRDGTRVERSRLIGLER
ncbi:MAG: hypothetical protein AB7L36_00620 [Sphingomonadaceae bacterium]